MQKIVLIGAGIAHSLSPALHNSLFERYGLPFRYELLPLRPEEVGVAVAAMKRGGYHGANVTAPYKEVVLPALDALSPEAERVGAVNTILIRDGMAVGFNTDIAGVDAALAGDPVLARPCSAAVIGTGGAARAAVDYLSRVDMLRSLTVYSRDRNRAAEFVGRWKDAAIVGAAVEDYRPADLVVHATPLGLVGRPGIAIEGALLAGTETLFDMIYVPVRTQLTQAAERLGIRVIPGSRMFVGQALEAFAVWTGIRASESDLPGNLFKEDEQG